MLWCWHPRCVPVGPVRIEDYRCCCGSCDCKNGFLTFVIIDIVITLIFASAGPVNQIVLTLLQLAISLMYPMLGLAAIFTLKPAYMQIYWIICVCYTVVGGLIVFFMVIFSLFEVSLFSSAEKLAEKEEDKEKLAAAANFSFSKFTRKAAFELDNDSVILFFAVAYCSMTILRLRTTFTFYRFVRDRQLEIENMAADRPSNLQQYGGYPNQNMQQFGGYPNQNMQQFGGYPNQNMQQFGGYPNQNVQQFGGYSPQNPPLNMQQPHPPH